MVAQVVQRDLHPLNFVTFLNQQQTSTKAPLSNLSSRPERSAVERSAVCPAFIRKPYECGCCWRVRGEPNTESDLCLGSGSKQRYLPCASLQ
jgi:hypothetical protein